MLEIKWDKSNFGCFLSIFLLAICGASWSNDSVLSHASRKRCKCTFRFYECTMLIYVCEMECTIIIYAVMNLFSAYGAFCVWWLCNTRYILFIQCWFCIQYRNIYQKKKKSLILFYAGFSWLRDDFSSFPACYVCEGCVAKMHVKATCEFFISELCMNEWYQQCMLGWQGGNNGFKIWLFFTQMR